MTLRDHCTPKQVWAHRILDSVRAGVEVDPVIVNQALVALGETPV